MSQRYQPPHLRQQAAGQAFAQFSSLNPRTRAVGSDDRSRPINTSRGGHPNAPRPSRKDWSTPAGASSSTYTLASPASDLQPMRRSPMKMESQIDDMELLQSVSRSGGDGAEGDALKDWNIQEKYRRYIDERLDKHYAMYNRTRHTSPPSDATDELQGLGSIVLLLRKLREGVVASHRLDTFAIDVFETSCRIAILARNPPQLLSSLSGLIPGLYQAIQSGGQRDPTTHSDLADDLDRLKIQDNRIEFTSILLLYHLAHSRSRQIYHSTLINLTAPINHTLRSPFIDAASVPTPRTQPFIPLSSLTFAIKANKALAEETFDPFRYFSLITDTTNSSPYERAVLSWAEQDVRERAWKVLSRAYLDVRLDWAGKWIGEDDRGKIEDWAGKYGKTVEGGKIKLK